MDKQKRSHEKNEEISIIDIIIFFKIASGNIYKAIFICLLVGGIHNYSRPNLYEFSTVIELAIVAGKKVEAPEILFEKIKLPGYFLPLAYQACNGSSVAVSGQADLFGKIKISINRQTQYLSFIILAPNVQEAKACLNEVIAEISSNQEIIAKTLVENIKQKTQVLKGQLNRLKEIPINYPYIAKEGSQKSDYYNNKILFNNFNNNIYNEINILSIEIISLEQSIEHPSTSPLKIVSPITTSTVPVNKMSTLKILGIGLIFGVIFGCLYTEVVSRIRKYASRCCKQG